MMHRELRGSAGTGPYPSMHGALVAFARRFVDPDTAEDLVQEAFVRAMEGGRRDVNHLPLAYFKMIVRNLAMDLFAKRMRDRTLAEKAGSGADDAAPPPATHALLEDDLRERLAELSQRQWESLVMTVVYGMSEREAASAADVSRSAVAGSRDRALRWLRGALPEEAPRPREPARMVG